jgi:hypothetical protein
MHASRFMDHQVFLEEVQQFMDDFDMPFDSAANLVHDLWLDNNKSYNKNAAEFLGKPLEGCAHCRK